MPSRKRCLRYATCSTTNQKSVTLRITRSNAGVSLSFFSSEQVVSSPNGPGLAYPQPSQYSGHQYTLTRARSSNQSLHAGQGSIRSLSLRVRETACTSRDSDQQVSCLGCGSPLVALTKDQVRHCSGELIILVVVTQVIIQ